MRNTNRFYFFILTLLFAATATPARTAAGDNNPSFATVPELHEGFDLLYIQKFPEAREKFAGWEARHPAEPLGEVAIAASYLFEEFYRQGVLTSDFFLNEKKFLNGIDTTPDPAQMKSFADALERTRALAKQRQEKDPKDQEALYALTLAAGMESDADMVLRKQRLDAVKRMRQANGYAKDLLAQRPDTMDAYVALGTANYIIGSLSAGFRFMLFFGGVQGDKKLGMEQLGKAADGGRYLQPFAKIMLALAARREKQNALAQKLLGELSTEFPSSPLFAGEYAKAMGLPVPAEMRAR